MDSPEVRLVCHKKYRLANWYPVQEKIPIYLAYRDHIGMHPNDYWGRCKEEIVPIPDLDGGVKDWEAEGYFGDMRSRRWKR